MKLYIVDAFTSKAFAGNPAAICLLQEPQDADWLQRVAVEMNLSETAFLLERGEGEYDLRWFTPKYEVELCGHATLASAHVLWTENVCAAQSIRFHTKSGVLTATRASDRMTLDFPATPAEEAEVPAELLEALGVQRPQFVGKSKFDRFVVVDSEETVRSLTPDFARLGQVKMRGVIVTAAAAEKFDFVSRYFAPAAGIDEDPVTGSAHCCLAPYWSEQLGKREMSAYQASARGGSVHVELDGARVKLTGQAVTVMSGALLPHTLDG